MVTTRSQPTAAQPPQYVPLFLFPDTIHCLPSFKRIAERKKTRKMVLQTPHHDKNLPSNRRGGITDIGMLMSLKSWPEFAIHVRGAVRNGLTELEIREAILHASVYLGLPAGVEAFRAADAALDDMARRGELVRTMDKLSPDAPLSS